ncbi:hypothetical protein CEUSTIGMA_g8291.t1 [Chlamydomonas eustigma]|uniref:PDZ domain-containing protein n=1 Tax=Chlamydomonas eustigma TaxID=1157962 RepID=A0A250XCS4_9CHLO|nr:hypothetical protein CEUSTIGMA_g8291.t1 [Chlamydomonas eustigma]|eukprot:GAX80856.1 hypothetical protein CEUSTIGMA_g8291.t1 [Chlamydomonas eustigma]
MQHSINLRPKVPKSRLSKRGCSRSCKSSQQSKVLCRSGPVADPPSGSSFWPGLGFGQHGLAAFVAAGASSLLVLFSTAGLEDNRLMTALPIAAENKVVSRPKVFQEAQISEGSQEGSSLSDSLLPITTESTSSNGITPLMTMSSETEDRLLEVVRQMETRLGSAVGGMADMLSPVSSEYGEDPIQADVISHTLIQEVWEVVDQNYLDARNTGFDAQKWARLRDAALSRSFNSVSSGYRAIKEMMATGLSDPYCRFITPKELSLMKKYDITGIGLNLGTGEEYERKTGRPLAVGPGVSKEEGGVYVVGVSQGSIADKAGIRQGDQFLQVDNATLGGFSPFQVSALIQGQRPERSDEHGDPTSASSSPSPSKVELKVRHPDGTMEAMTVERPVQVTPSPVNSKVVKEKEDNVGVIRLTSFNARAQRDLKAAIVQVLDQGANRLQLDLRDNRGGLVSEGLEVAKLFLGGGAPIVVTETRLNSEVPIADGQPFTAIPLTVLVNDHTASAAEIVAGALKDNCRAVLAGKRTYGKGLIQSVYELSDGSGMVLTVGKYLTPKRIEIDRFGIEPNFATAPTLKEERLELDACLVK